MITNTVFYSPITPMYENRAPGTIITGSPGSGKSYFMQNLTVNCFQQEIIPIILDPKNDFEKLIPICPQLKLVDISKKQSLDPFVNIENIDTNFIIQLIETICGGLTQEQNVAIMPIVDDYIKMSRNGGATFLKLANYMYSSRNIHVQQIGTMLKANQNNEYGRVLFNEEKSGLRLNKEPSIIKLFGLPMPKVDNMADWNREERFGSAIIMIIIKMLRQLLNGHNPIPVVLFIDESHIILENKAIYKIVEEFLILGRSLNVATILASQNVNHFPEDFSNYVSDRFQFRSSKKEIKEFLRRFNEDSTISEASYVNFGVNCGTGEAIFIDRNQRIGTIRIRSDLALTTNAIENNAK